MQLAKIVASALLCSSAAFASAQTLTTVVDIDLQTTSEFGNAYTGTALAGLTFLDTYNFSVPGTSELDSALTSFATKKTFDLDITSFNLYQGSTLVAAGTRELQGVLDVWTLNGQLASTGAYSLRVGGTIRGTLGGSYGGNANISPVPEPEAWSMLGLGLGVAGLMARRRRTKRAAC